MSFSKFSKSSLGQGAIEYFIIISVVLTIALISVGVTSTIIFPAELQLQQKATKQELENLSISITESSFNSSTNEFILKLKNNYSTRVKISNLKIGDANSDFDQNMLAGASSIFILSSSGECTNNEIVKDLTITFQSKYGLEHLQSVKNVSFKCNNATISQILRFFYIPQRDLVDGIISNMNILDDGNYSFSFNSGSGDAVTYYSFESANGSTVEDMVGSADGTLVNGASIGAGGKFGSNALIINNDSQYFDIPDFSSPQITIMGWYYFESIGGDAWNTIFCREGGTYHHLLINDSSREVGFYNNGFYSSGTILNLGTLYHFAVVKDGYNQKIYLDGDLIMNSDSSFNNSSYPFGIIGNYVNGASQGAWGWIDEVKIFNRVLSESEVLAEYNSTGISEDSNYVTKLIDTKKTTSSFDSVIVNPNGLKYGEEIDPESETSLANGLVALWHLNESSGTIASDSSGNGYDGVRSSGVGVSGITQTIDGEYIVYTFNSSGTFTIDNDITAEVLVVGGGGAGGYGGGGGAGGLIHESNFSIPAGTYSVTIGNGGNPTAYPNAGSNGEDSVFSSLTAIGGGGGGGGAVYSRNGKNGGSGGGGGFNDTLYDNYTGGSGVSGQGNSGGNTNAVSCSPSGAGGGAGGVGGDNAGNGGVGLAYSISGSSIYYAGGGGGGAWCVAVGSGGLGGGGSGATGSTNSVGGNGTPNTGGGGGGGYTGGSGGSGIVIIRYLTSQGTATISSGSSSGLWGTLGGNFNGSSNYIQAPLATNSVSNVTLSAWFKTNNYRQAGQLVAHVGSDASGNGYGFAVNNESTTDGSLLILYSAINWYDTGINITDSEWHHGVLVLNGSSQPSFYLDGELIASPSTSVPNTPTNYIEIARNDYPSARYFNGSIDEVAIWDRAFSASEVNDLFNKGVSKIGVQARACSLEDCSTEWSSVQYGSNEYKYFSLPRSKYFQFKITSELIPFEAKLVIPESCVSFYGANSWDYCGAYFWDYLGCSNNNWHNNYCYWYEYGYCYPSIDCYSQGADTCGNYGGCYWNTGYCYNNYECYYNYDSSSCESYPACDWSSYYSCEGSMWSYCYENFPTEESCTASECYWGGDGCYNNAECYYLSTETCGNYGSYCYLYDYGSCNGDPYSYCAYNFYDEGSCSSQNGCYWNPSYCGGEQYSYCNYNFYDEGSCSSQNGCYWQIDYAYCGGDFRCEDQLHEGSSSCTAFGSGCNYTAPLSTDYLSYFYNATPKLMDINILFNN